MCTGLQLVQLQLFWRCGLEACRYTPTPDPTRKASANMLRGEFRGGRLSGAGFTPSVFEVEGGSA